MPKEKDKFLNFEQALNKLKKDEEGKKKHIHDEAQKQQISVATPSDRKRYLRYCLSLLEYVDKDLMSHLPENIRVTYTGKEMAKMLKTFLWAKINFATNEAMSKWFGVPINIIDDLEFIGKIAVQRAIAKRQKSGIPIIGA